MSRTRVKLVALGKRWLAASGHTPHKLAGSIGSAGPCDFLPMTNLDARPVCFHPNYPPDTQPMAFASIAGQPAPLRTHQPRDLDRRVRCAVRWLAPVLDNVAGFVLSAQALKPGEREAKDRRSELPILKGESR